MTIRHPASAAIVLLLAGCATPPIPELSTPPVVAASVVPTDTTAPAIATPPRPTLAVMLVVDQLRSDLLGRHDSLWTGGFRRLIDEGRYYINASHAHSATSTAVGHASLSTGVHPFRHGVVENAWWERSGRRWVRVENIDDSTVAIVGFPKLGGVSPRHLMRPGLAEWMLAADSNTRIASVSGKDRGAVHPAAHTKGQVYWFEESVGRFVTSTYYRDAYPEWVDRFHETVLPRYAADSAWESRVPASARAAAGPDTAAWENYGERSWFPHRFADQGRRGEFWSWFAQTPGLDALTLDFAETMVTSLALGRDETVDFLNVSLSQSDRIGHRFGPHSLEQLDNLLRLDRELGEFFAFLDRTVGAGRWVVGLSADHGSLVAPETPQPGEPRASRATAEERAALRAVQTEADAHGGDPATPARVVAALKRLPFVADAWTHEQLLHATPADSFAVLARRSLYPGRAAAEFSTYGVEVRFVEGRYGAARGSGHGTPYWYDRHVPIVFMGVGIPAGRDTTRASTTDFAPTLARLLGVPAPTDLDGRPLAGVVTR
jgi:predicted AlkP superfamily pyrophosphatase or phosphodiesterase